MNVMVAQQIEEQKSSYRHATMHRPPTNLPASLAAALDQHAHRHLNHTYSKPEFNPKNCQNFLFPSHLEELATFRTN